MIIMAMSENTIKVLEYLKANKGVNVTAADLEADLGIPKRTVDGCFTSGIQRKNLGHRVPAEVELADGSHKNVKFLVLNDAGLAFDPTATEEAA